MVTGIQPSHERQWIPPRQLQSNKMEIRTGLVSIILGTIAQKTMRTWLILTGLMVQPAMGRIIFEDLHLLPAYIKAHGVIMGLAFGVMMPLGVIAIGILNFRGNIWIHAAWQLISWCLMIAGFGLGVRIARITDKVSCPNVTHTCVHTQTYTSIIYISLSLWKSPFTEPDKAYNNAHTKLGTVVVAMLLVQPLFGLIHHMRFRKTHRPNAWTHLHVWYGRMLILLGIINGGLGLQLAANSKGGEIAYGVVGGVLGACVLLVAGLTEYKRWLRPRTPSQPPPVAEARG